MEFDYTRATDVAMTLALGAKPNARYLGGGTNLVDLMKLGVESPEHLVDVTALGHDRIEETVGGLRVGAGVRNSDLAANLYVRRRFPMLAQALLSGASGQLRNQATVGGNLMQRTRCLYFMDVSKPCNKRVPGSGCPARTGVHANLAILGASESCVATNPSDLAVALVALDAVVHFVDANGTHQLPVEQFFRLPGTDPARDTNLPTGALITGIELPVDDLVVNSHYRKVRERASYAFAIGSVAVALKVHEDTVTDVRIALGAVAAMPWRARTAEAMLVGKPATPESFRAAADAELAAAEPLRDNAYKVQLISNLIVAELQTATDAAKAGSA
jgi:xanthine dehydrogenase YagS FAD-binding subunit